MTETILEYQDVGKGFFGVRALRGVSFALQKGHLLGIVGENGAGKSTLMNILGGVFPADSGRMTLSGTVYAPASPADAAGHGVAFIHQELNLFTNLSIAENIHITSFPRRAGGLIDKKALGARTRSLLDAVDLPLAPDTPVARLSQGERQLVEIAKALSLDARIIIFDEPTTSLTSRETERLFGILERLRLAGTSVIYISHVLGDVLRLCDEILVLRDGEVAGAGPKGEFTLDRLVSLMVGRSISQMFPPRADVRSAEKVLEVRALSQPGIVDNIEFALHRGEVLGISGLMGSGRSELARILFGLDAHERGEILVNGAPLGRGSGASIKRGMAFLTEDRREEGLLMEASITDNIALASLPSFARSVLKILERSRMGEAIAAVARSVQITSADAGAQPVKTLSGGNQQKVVLARWLLKKPSVFILDEPTRGIDVGAKHEIYRIINDLATEGSGVLLISSEIEELIGMCDRILVMAHGEIRGCMDREDFDRENILRAALEGGRL
jgi:ribose transport system ATP-binding protein